jgi:hypothetical protein
MGSDNRTDMAHPQNESLRQVLDRVVFPRGSKRRALAKGVGGIAAAVALVGTLTVGAEAVVNTLAPAPKITDLTPDKIDSVQKGAVLRLSLAPDKHYEVLIITNTDPDTHQETTDTIRVAGNDIKVIEGAQVSDGAPVADIANLGVNQDNQVPIDVSFTDAQGQTKNGILTVSFLQNPDINLGNQPPITVNYSDIQRNDIGQRSITATGLPVDSVTFENPSAPTSSTSSQ